MTFREAIEDDVKNTFLDLETFAETHMINGKEMTACVQDGLFTALDGRLREDKRIGLYENSFTVYVSAKDLGTPKAGTWLEVDGRKFYVINALKEGGMRRIVLSRSDAR